MIDIIKFLLFQAMKRSKKHCRVTLDEDSCKKSKADTTDTSVRRGKEIYNFNRNNYREIGNERTTSISLLPARRLVALCSGHDCLLEIYTLDGFLVTTMSFKIRFKCRISDNGIHLTDNMMVLSGPNVRTTRYNDYNVQNDSKIFLGFDCDKDGFIYAPIFKENAIAIYSHDLEYLEFDAYNSEYGEVISIRIRKDTMVILSAFYIRNNKYRFTKTFTIQRYDLSKKIIIQTVKFNHYFMSDLRIL